MTMLSTLNLRKYFLLALMGVASNLVNAESAEELSSDENLEIRNETVYVRDTLYVPLRGGQSTEHRILHQGLKSGIELTRLGVNEDTGYSKVETQSGMIGWIPSQYLVQEPSATIRLAETAAVLKKLQQDHERAVKQLNYQSNERIAKDSELSELSKTNSSLQNELNTIKELAADVISIEARNEELKLEQNSLNDQINLLIESNETLRDKSAQSWFIRGAGAVLISLFLGFLLARRLYHSSGGGWR